MGQVGDDKFVEGMRLVCSLADQLIDCPSLDSLYRRSVELVRERLGIERSALCLYDEKLKVFRSTYGTNFSGQTTQESDITFNIEGYEDFVLDEAHPIHWIQRDELLKEWRDGKFSEGKKGWQAITSVRSDAGLIGLFLNDAAITDAPIDPLKQELLAAYSFFLGNTITRKRVEQSLRESEEKYRLLFYNNPQPMYVYDLETLSILAVNDAAVKLYGYTREEFLGMKVNDFRMREEVDAFIESIESFRSGSNMVGEWRHMRKDGRMIDVEITSHAVTFERRRARLVLVMDITEQKRTQESVEHLAAFPRFNPNPIIEFNDDAEISYFNEAADEMRRSFDAIDLWEILPKNVKQVIKDCLTKEGERLRIETKIGDRTISWSFFSIESSANKKWFVHCYGGEISERLRLEAQYRHAQKMESIGQLAGGVAHDFNNILTAIIGYSNLVKIRCEDKPELVNDVDQITLAAQRAANLTKQLLAFSRRQYVSLQVLNLNQVLQNVQTMLLSLTGEHIRFECSYVAELPSILGDANMLDQVIINLGVNARDAMPNGGVLNIQTAMVEMPGLENNQRMSRYVRLRVSDTGMGMDEETRSKIFEPFFTTKEFGHGTGLGLATVYGIVQQHQGWIEVKSTLGVGSTFDVFFPVCNETEKHKIEEVVKKPNLNAIISASGVVLIVEDEEAVRLIARTILEKQGFRVIEAESGTQALKIWEEQSDNIDILFSDMVMPNNITGLDLAHKFVKEKPSLRVILTSGYNVDLMKSKEPLPPNTVFVAKPYSSLEVMEAIAQKLSD